jgi:hypothetical protein
VRFGRLFGLARPGDSAYLGGVTAATHLLPAPKEPQPHGGWLRRGNPGNKGCQARSTLARNILAAATPKAARQLVHIALKGTLPDTGKEIAVQDRVKALDMLLARGGVPIRTELTGADGAPFTVLLGVAAHGD